MVTIYLVRIVCRNDICSQRLRHVLAAAHGRAKALQNACTTRHFCETPRGVVFSNKRPPRNNVLCVFLCQPPWIRSKSTSNL